MIILERRLNHTLHLRVEVPPLDEETVKLADLLVYQRLVESGRTNISPEGLREWVVPFSDRTAHITLWKSNELVGTVRVVKPALVDGVVSMPMTLENVPWPQGAPIEESAEIVRLAGVSNVSPPTLPPLMGGIWTVARYWNLKYLGFFTTKGVWKHLLQGGFPLFADHGHQHYGVEDITGYLSTKATMTLLSRVNPAMFSFLKSFADVETNGDKMIVYLSVLFHLAKVWPVGIKYLLPTLLSPKKVDEVTTRLMKHYEPSY